MKPTTLTNLATSQAAFEIANIEVQSAARRVFNAAETFKDSRPDEEKWLIEDHFGEWNSERDHIFWAETDFYEARIHGDQVKMETGYTLRNETNSFWLHFPVAWLTLDGASLNAVLAAEWDKLLSEAREAKAREYRKYEWERYQTYLRLKGEFEGKPAPEEPKS
jgi:hypothetical protein